MQSSRVTLLRRNRQTTMGIGFRFFDWGGCIQGYGNWYNSAIGEHADWQTGKWITRGDKVKSETFGVQFDRSLYPPAEQDLVSRSTNLFDEGLGILLLQWKSRIQLTQYIRPVPWWYPRQCPSRCSWRHGNSWSWLVCCLNQGERMATLYFTVEQSIDTVYGEACIFGGCELVAFAFLPLLVCTIRSQKVNLTWKVDVSSGGVIVDQFHIIPSVP